VSTIRRFSVADRVNEVNYHTWRISVWKNKQELDELFTQVLAALSKEGLITLEQVDARRHED